MTAVRRVRRGRRRLLRRPGGRQHQGLLDRPPRRLRERRQGADARPARRAARPSSAPARSSGPTATCASPTTRPRTRRTAAPRGPVLRAPRPDGLMAAGGYYMMAPDQVARFRTAVDDDRRGDDLGQTPRRRRGRGRDDRRAGSSRPAPAASIPEHPRLELMRRKGLYAHRGWPPDDVLHEAGALAARGRGVAGGAAARRVVRRPRGTHRAAPSVNVCRTARLIVQVRRAMLGRT